MQGLTLRVCLWVCECAATVEEVTMFSFFHHHLLMDFFFFKFEALYDNIDKRCTAKHKVQFGVWFCVKNSFTRSETEIVVHHS